jgi:uncharacterized LabA/DUF88 family protein
MSMRRRPISFGEEPMLRGMVFVDHMNFEIALRQYYSHQTLPNPRLDYNALFKELVLLIPNVDLVKTFIFAPKPDEFLMNDIRLSGYYSWVAGLKNAPYLDVIEGSYIARPVSDDTRMDINDKTTYYKVEKGTDINLAVHAINKAFYNSFDIGFFLSADSDYITVYSVLKSIGKLTVVVAVKGQNINRLKQHVDNCIILDDSFFCKCLRR